MKAFLDANVLISVLNKEYPLFTYSSRVLSLTITENFDFYTSPLCLGIAYYFAEKKSGRSLANKKMKLLCEYLKITIMDHLAVRKTIENKMIKDFEDGLQYYSALEAGCDCIITENGRDFYFSKLEILDCQTFLKRYAV